MGADYAMFNTHALNDDK